MLVILPYVILYYYKISTLRYKLKPLKLNPNPNPPKKINPKLKPKSLKSKP